jgi:hypothetical protein
VGPLSSGCGRALTLSPLVVSQYVVETKYVGEQGVAGAPTEVVGSDSAVVDERVKQAPAGDRTVVVENVDVPGSEVCSCAH